MPQPKVCQNVVKLPEIRHTGIQTNNKSKYLDSSSKIQVPANFQSQLIEALHEVNVFTVSRESGGYVSKKVIKAEFEVDCI